MDYYGIIKSAIGFGGYVLADMESKIDRLWVEGHLTTDQRTELRTLAAESAREADQLDVQAKLAELEHRVWELEHPTDQYAVWTTGYQTQQGEIVRYDVTGDGEYDLCQYNGGRSYTALSIGKIEGWNLLDRELTPTHAITRDADGGYVLTPIEEEATTDADE